MRFLVKARIPVEAGNAFIRDPKFSKRMDEMLGEIKPETAYFLAEGGQRNMYLIVNLDGAHQIPAVAEPLWLALKADVDFVPIMDAADMAKATPSIERAGKKYK